MSKLKRIENALLFLTLLLLPTQLGRHFWPEFSFVYSLPIDYLSPTIYFWDLLVIVLISYWLLQKPHINKLALNLFLIFILSQSVTLIGSDVKIGPGLIRLEQYLISGLFGIYLSSSDFISNLKRIYLPLTLGIAGEAILAILQFIKGQTLGLWILGERTFSISTPAIAKFDFYGLEFLRPYGTFPHPNVLAGFMVIVSLLLSGWRQAKLAIFLAGITVLLTVSRVAIVAGLWSSFFLLKKKGRILLLLAVILLLPVLYTRFSSAFNFDVLSLTRREEQLTIAWEIWLLHPFSGVGLNNFIPSAADQLLAGPNRFLQPVHNIFLLLLAETGMLGLLGFLGLIGFPIFRLLKLFPKPYILNPLLLVWLMIIFLGIFDHYFLTLPQGIRMLFLVWGLSLSIVTSNKHGER